MKAYLFITLIGLALCSNTVFAKNDDQKKGKNKGKGSLPPGLQKKVNNGGQLPPGWQKNITKVIDSIMIYTVMAKWLNR